MSVDDGVAVKQYLLKTGAPAGAAHVSTDTGDTYAYGKGLDVGLCNSGSVQINWSGLTGVVNATLSVYCSSDGVNWIPKSDADHNPLVLTLSGTDGQDSFSLNQVITEEFYQVRYAPVGVTGGAVECLMFAK